MNDNKPVSVDINSYDIFAPVIAAVFIGALKTAELVSLQKNEPFDESVEIKRMVNLWSTMTSSFQKIARKEQH